ncbi:10800_t:CDS:2 [Funneliformis mosseae]|uniref:DNA 3'-5' helicase n=1 Tax=Funneliformis mosseae TaxID=27381 RepID=A0A9N9D8T5_FUNMO|nr:10800_t:CDS:2 [Funneliformis mosseae]
MIKKSHVITKKGKDENSDEKVIIQKSNFDASSRQIEHAILIALLEQIISVLEASDLLLEVCIDRDLDFNKTLANIPVELILYKYKAEERIRANTFYLFFAKLIIDFDAIIKCQGWQERLLNKNYTYVNKQKCLDLKEMVTLAAQMIFGYDQLREGQLEAVESYLSGKDTLVSLKTGGGKTFCYAICALLFEGITIIISPLKALMEDQKRELIHFSIPCASIYANTTQGKIEQSKIFEEIVLGFIKVIFVTSEKLCLNKEFQYFINNMYNKAKMHFVIDEAHCILDYSNFSKFGTAYRTGRRDGNEAKSVIFYSVKKDLKTNFAILAENCETYFNNQNIADDERERTCYLDTGTHKICEVLLFCQNQYECCVQLINRYHLWNGDNIPAPCLKCDNCRNRIKERPTYGNCIDDIFHLLEIIEEIKNNTNCEITEDDIVEVFCKSNTRKIRESGLTELESYKNLVVRGYVKQKISLYRSSPSAQTLLANMFIIGLVAGIKENVIADSWYYWINKK